MDGIKTGYTRASGFNLLTSVHRDGRSLVAVVMGGRSAGARDRVMENLIDDHIAEASTVRTASMVAEASGAEEPAAPPADQEAAPVRPRPAVVAVNVPARAPSVRAAPPPVAEGDNAEDDVAPALRVAAVMPAVQQPAAPAPVPARNIDQTRVASLAADQHRANAPPPNPIRSGRRFSLAGSRARMPTRKRPRGRDRRACYRAREAQDRRRDDGRRPDGRQVRRFEGRWKRARAG